MDNFSKCGDTFIIKEYSNPMPVMHSPQPLSRVSWWHGIGASLWLGFDVDEL